MNNGKNGVWWLEIPKYRRIENGDQKLQYINRRTENDDKNILDDKC